MYDQIVMNIILNDEFLLNQLLMLNKIKVNYLNDHYKIHHHIMIMMLQNEIYELVYYPNVILNKIYYQIYLFKTIQGKHSRLLKSAVSP